LVRDAAAAARAACERREEEASRRASGLRAARGGDVTLARVMPDRLEPLERDVGGKPARLALLAL
jgi:hypothetical protein